MQSAYFTIIIIIIILANILGISNGSIIEKTKSINSSTILYTVMGNTTH
jgi:hypothetical protein